LKKPVQSNEDDSFIFEGLVLGLISQSIFDSHFILRQGDCEMSLWPLREFNPRMVCAGEYLVKKTFKSHGMTHHKSEMKLNIGFKNYGKVRWSLEGKKKVSSLKLQHR